MIDILAASTDPDLATTGDVLALLHGATTTDVVASTQELDHLGRLIRRASAWAESVIGTPLPVAKYRETVPAFGDRHLRLSRRPVRAITRIFDATDTGTASDLSTGVILEHRAAGLVARDRGFAWTNIEARIGGTFSLGLTGAQLPGMETRPYLVEYIAGYVPLGGLSTDSPNWSTQAYEGTSTGTSIPGDLQQGVILKALELYANPQAAQSRSIGDLSVSYGSAGPERSAAAEWLAPYARV